MRSLIPVRYRLSLSLSLLVLALISVKAQNADDFFHGGAQHFLTNNIPSALEVVTNGLQRFPEDVKLQKLYELLNQQQQQQQQQQQNEDQKEQQQDQKDDQKQDQSKQDEKQDQQKKDEAQKKMDEQQAKSDDKSKGKSDEKKEAGEPQQVAAHQMTPEEAKQLLDAQKDDEQVLIFQPQGDPKNQTKRLKDW